MGKALVDELRANGATVIPLTSQDVDLTDFENTKRVFSHYAPDIVYHLAARVSGIMGNMRGQGEGYFYNTQINTNTVEAARLAGARKIIAMGSAAIYSDVVDLPMREEQVWAGRPHSSEAGYAHAKRGMLAQLESYRTQWGLDFAYCISTNLFGPNDKFDESYGHVIPSLVSKFHRAAHSGGLVTVWGTGAPQRDFLYVEDAARAIRLIGETFSGPINLATGTAITIRDTVDLIRRISGYTGNVIWDSEKPDGQKLRSYDVSKLSSLGFKPQYTLEEALTKTFEWFDSNVSVLRR
jgi:GDP-L-fucose synthase